MGRRVRLGILRRACSGHAALRTNCRPRSRGTVLNMEMYRTVNANGNLEAIKGVAQDNKENICKLVF
jgi:hypothetical protein